MLIFPAETRPSRSTAGLQNWNVDQHSSYIRRLTLVNVDDRLVRDGFDEPVTQHVERRSKRTVLTRLQALHNVRTDRLIVDQRPPGMVDEHSIHKSPGPSLQRV